MSRSGTGIYFVSNSDLGFSSNLVFDLVLHPDPDFISGSGDDIGMCLG